MKMKRNQKMIMPVPSTGIIAIKFNTRVSPHHVLLEKFFQKGETFKNLSCRNNFVCGFFVKKSNQFQLYSLDPEKTNINIEENVLTELHFSATPMHQRGKECKSDFYKIKQKNTFKKKFFLSSYKKETEIKTISISLASSQDILRWAERTLPNGKIIGKVTNANTLHYKTFKPQKGGLFCERIFGPVKDFECACGKIQKSHNVLTQNLFSKKRDVLQNSLTEKSKINEQLALSEQNSTQDFMKSKNFLSEQGSILTKFTAEKRNSILKNIFFDADISQTVLKDVQSEQTNKNLFQQVQSESQNSRLRLFTGLPNAPEKQSLQKFCPNCDVEYTWSISRRYKLGYIQLTLPVTHVWYLKGTTSLLGNLLCLKKKVIISLTYNSETTVLETSQNSFQINNLLRTSSPLNLFKSWTNLISLAEKEKINNIKDKNLLGLIASKESKDAGGSSYGQQPFFDKSSIFLNKTKQQLYNSELSISNARKFEEPIFKAKRLKSWRSYLKNISKVDTIVQKRGDQNQPEEDSIVKTKFYNNISTESKKNGPRQSDNKFFDSSPKFSIKRVHDYSRFRQTSTKMKELSISFYILYKNILKQKFYAEQSLDQTFVVTFPFQRLGLVDPNPTLLAPNGATCLETLPLPSRDQNWRISSTFFGDSKSPKISATTTTVDTNTERMSLRSQKNPWSLFKIGISKKIWKIFYKKALYKALRKVEKIKEQEKKKFVFLSRKKTATSFFTEKECESDLDLQSSIDSYLFKLLKKIHFLKKAVLVKFYAIGNQTADQDHFGLWPSDARKNFQFGTRLGTTKPVMTQVYCAPGQSPTSRQQELEQDLIPKQHPDMSALNSGIFRSKLQSSFGTLFVPILGTPEVIYFQDLERFSPHVKIIFEKLVNVLTTMLNLFGDLPQSKSLVQTGQSSEVLASNNGKKSVENVIPTKPVFLKKLLYLERSLSCFTIGANFAKLYDESKEKKSFWTLYNTKVHLVTNFSKSFLLKFQKNSPLFNKKKKEVQECENSVRMKFRTHICVRGSRGLCVKNVTSQNSQKYSKKSKMNLQTSLHLIQNIAKSRTLVKLDLNLQRKFFAQSPIRFRTNVGPWKEESPNNYLLTTCVSSNSKEGTSSANPIKGLKQAEYRLVPPFGSTKDRRIPLEKKFRNKFYQFSFIHRWYDSYSFQSILMYISAPVNFDDKIIQQYSSTSDFSTPYGKNSVKGVLMQDQSGLCNDLFFKNAEKMSVWSTSTNFENNAATDPSFSGAGLLQKILFEFNINEVLIQNLIDLKKLPDKIFELEKNIRNYKQLEDIEPVSKISKPIRKSDFLTESFASSVYDINRRCKEYNDFSFHIENLPSLKNIDYILCGQYLKREDQEKNYFSLEEKLKNFRKKLTILKQLKPKLIRRIKLLQLFEKRKTEPASMILKMLPVLPADLRPIMKLGDQIAASDLNRLYQRIIYRNERLKKFLKEPVTRNSEVTRFAHRLLQEAVDNLIENGKSGVKPETDSRNRTLKSLSAILKGKTGRFRQYLLGKRVDYSGRSVIVVGPKLKMHECGIPYDMAIELFLPFLLKRILNYKLVKTVLGAKKFIQTNNQLTKELLREIMTVTPVLLNRAPTLHRLGIQAFQPKLVDGKAILLHPLVCPAFNADFDGDQMAVHVPITVEARAEALKLMFSRNNLLSPATGDPLVLPSQDMVLGCYYLTTEKFSKQKSKQIKNQDYVNFLHSNLYFNSLEDVLKKYNKNIICVEQKKRSSNPSSGSGFFAIREGSTSTRETTSGKCEIIKTTGDLLSTKETRVSVSEINNLRTHFVFSIRNKEIFWNKNIFATELLLVAEGQPLNATTPSPFRDKHLVYDINRRCKEWIIPDVTSFQENSKKDCWALSSQNLHSNIWLKWEQNVETGGEHEPPLEIRLNRFGFRQEIYSKIFRNYDKLNNRINQYIKTTPGKILFNLLFLNSTQSSSELLK